MFVTLRDGSSEVQQLYFLHTGHTNQQTPCDYYTDAYCLLITPEFLHQPLSAEKKLKGKSRTALRLITLNTCWEL